MLKYYYKDFLEVKNMKEENFRIENPCRIVISDYRITINIPEDQYSKLAEDADKINDIFLLKEHLETLPRRSRNSFKILLKVLKLAILYNAISITDYHDIRNFGQYMFQCTFVFASIKDMQDFQNSLQVFIPNDL